MAEKLNELKKSLKEGKLVIGTKNTLKNLSRGNVSKIWLSKNTPEKVSDEIIGYAKLSEVPVERLDIPNDELGIICKKQYSVSVASLLKGD